MSFSPRFYDILFKSSFFFVGGLAGSMYATHHHHNNLKILKQDLNILHPPLVEFGADEDKILEVSKDPHVKEVLKYGNPGAIFSFSLNASGPRIGDIQAKLVQGLLPMHLRGKPTSPRMTDVSAIQHGYLPFILAR
jgi:hypothetical protein